MPAALHRLREHRIVPTIGATRVWAKAWVLLRQMRSSGLSKLSRSQNSDAAQHQNGEGAICSVGKRQVPRAVPDVNIRIVEIAVGGTEPC